MRAQPRAVAAVLTVLLHLLIVFALVRVTPIARNKPPPPPAVNETTADRLHGAGERIVSVDIRPSLSTRGLACAGSSYIGVGVTATPGSERIILEFILRDVTDRKQLEAQLFRLQRIDLLGQLAGGVIRDVENMMTSITSSAESLQASGPPESRKRAETIRETAEKASVLLQRILTFAGNGGEKLLPIQISPVLQGTGALVPSFSAGTPS